MENNAKEDCAATKTTANTDSELNPSSNINLNPPHSSEEQNDEQPRQSTTRTPFTDLSQMEADLALARTLQEQERAYMMLRMRNEGSAYGSWENGSWETGSYVLDVDEEDNFYGSHDGHDMEDEFGQSEDDEDDGNSFHMHVDGDDVSPNVELDPSAFSSDEAYARSLQDAEERELAARLLALTGLNGREVEDEEDDDHGENSQDTWEEVDTDELSYEELLALGEVVGSESRGLSVI